MKSTYNIESSFLKFVHRERMVYCRSVSVDFGKIYID